MCALHQKIREINSWRICVGAAGKSSSLVTGVYNLMNKSQQKYRTHS
jgi:hypothetical protein